MTSADASGERRRQQLEHPPVAAQVLGALQIERVGGAVEGDHVAFGGRGEAEDGERPVHPGVGASPDEQDLERDRRPGRVLQQPPPLGRHDGRPPTGRASTVSSSRTRSAGQALLVEQGLAAADAQLDPAVDLLGGQVGPDGADHRPGVVGVWSRAGTISADM